jgi:glyoxylase-like metal-dependent hydrolase (beta-lactamase superfamily II)
MPSEENMHPAHNVTRRSFLASTSCLGAALAFGDYFSLPALAGAIAQDSRVSPQLVADKGFAAVRKIGDGVYATVADFSKGLTSLSNGGFIVGKDAVLMVEGFLSPVGAAFQLETLRSVTQTPVLGAVDTHYHFDHSFGNATYGAAGIPVWAHAQAAPLMVQNYVNVQATDKTPLLDALKKKISNAPNDVERAHAQSDLNAYSLIFQSVDSTVLALPNHPLDPAKLPMTVDLGGRKAVIETHPGHSKTDLIVRVPEQNIVFTGDLVMHGFFPVTFDANMRAWHNVLASFADFGKDTLFVPGHGQICGQDVVATFRSALDNLIDKAGEFYKAGVPLEEAQKRYVIPDKFKDDYVFAWSLTVGTAMAKLYEEFKTGKS